LINGFDFENQLAYNHNIIGIAINNEFSFGVHINILGTYMFSPKELDEANFERYKQYIAQDVDNYIEFLEGRIIALKSEVQILKVKYIIDVINLCGRGKSYNLDELNEIRSRYGYFPIELKDD
jgi:hypothetical protein